MPNDVTYRRLDFSNMLPAWNMVDDACAGEITVKSKGNTYLPYLNKHDKSKDNKERNEAYISRSVFYPVAGRTLAGLVGAAFRKIPKLVAPAAMDYVASDITGSGTSVYQLSQAATSQTLRKGRCAILVDYPAVTPGVSLAVQRALNLRAYATLIDARSIINWRTEKVGGSQKLTLVVIEESVENNSGFGVEISTQYRVLELIDGVYTVTTWTKPDGFDSWIPSEPRIPLDGNGQAWGEIPIVFVGAESNTPDIDSPPLLDICSLNMAHYRNSADYEDSVFFVGQAQPWISGLDERWRDWMVTNGLYVGSRSPMLLPAGGGFGFAQANPNTLAKEAMDAKEQQMVAIGARLIQSGSRAKTATESDADTQAQHSTLSLVVSNVSEAITQALKWMARFNGVDDADIDFAISQEFTRLTFDPQAVQALVQLWQSGRLPASDMNESLRKMGLIDGEKTDEEVNDELESSGVGLAL